MQNHRIPFLINESLRMVWKEATMYMYDSASGAGDGSGGWRPQ